MTINKWKNVTDINHANEVVIIHRNFDGFDHDLYEMFDRSENGQWERSFISEGYAIVVCPFCGHSKYSEYDECCCGDKVSYISTYNLLLKLAEATIENNTVGMRKKWKDSNFTTTHEYTYMGYDFKDWYMVDNL